MISDEIIQVHNQINQERSARGIAYGTHYENCDFYIWRSHLDCNCAAIHDAKPRKDTEGKNEREVTK